jgi:imidazolonepropionase-like amidohydrolase
VPTLGGYYWMAGINEAIDPASVTPDPHMLPRLVELANYNLQQGTQSMRAGLAAGVRIGLGSDRGGVSGEDTALELVRMIHHGLPVSEALLAATATAALALGLEDQIGTVQPGRLADLVVVDGDVLAEPEVLLDRSRIWAVFQLGELVAGTALENDQRSDIRSVDR